MKNDNDIYSYCSMAYSGVTQTDYKKPNVIKSHLYKHVYMNL